jgi:hypothetical protein
MYATGLMSLMQSGTEQTEKYNLSVQKELATLQVRNFFLKIQLFFSFHKSI